MYIVSWKISEHFIFKGELNVNINCVKFVFHYALGQVCKKSLEIVESKSIALLKPEVSSFWFSDLP